MRARGTGNSSGDFTLNQISFPPSKTHDHQPHLFIPLLISQTIREISSIHEVVHEVDVVARDASTDKLDDADMVAMADHREAFSELIYLEFAMELALENNYVSASESTSPSGSRRGGGKPLGDGANFREVVDVGVFKEAIVQTSERGSTRNGGESETRGPRVSGEAGVRKGGVEGRKGGAGRGG